ncbi:PEP-CTERM sorting domain-containing protein (plasmid) [Tundrisphaera lichenicola]|uniref:PEP-CTERM sorting domain-containing protein n=1 Tax=Tundrisphaera lichenicola TaxID=2029860 RepID=UPI003EB9DEEA
MLKRFSFLIVAFALHGFTAAQAAIITTVDRDSFQDALGKGSILNQDFDSIPVGTVLRTLSGITYVASNGRPIVTDSFLTSTPPNGLGSTSSGFFGNFESASFTFASSITAFAIDINTFAPSSGDFTVTLDTGDVVRSTISTFPNSSTGQFVGFTSDTAFNSLTIRTSPDPNTGLRYSYTLDSLFYGSASAFTVPEPSSLTLCGVAGLVGLIFARRRRGRLLD